jgi:amino acid adenylation domain-containing protein
MSSNPTFATAAFRLSTQQKRVWLEHDQGLAQHAQCTISLAGPLDVAKLQRSLQQLISKYEILRTALRRQPGVQLPFQVIQDNAAVSFNQETGANTAIEEFLRRERNSLTGIEAAPMIRALLVSHGPEKHTLVLTAPVFSVDSATLKKCFEEIVAMYGGDAGIRPDDVMQYADLVEWQNELLASDDTKAGRDFWRECCREMDPVTLEGPALPLEKKPEAPPTFDSLMISNSELAPRITALTSELNSSTEAVLLSAWYALLWRLVGNAQIPIACEVDGRRYEELQKALGPLALSLPIRLEFAPETSSFAQLVRKVEAAMVEARNWQECFAWSQAFAVENSYLPFAFGYYDLGGSQKSGGVDFRLERLQVISERFKLRVAAIRRESHMDLDFAYDTSRLDRATVERIAHYCVTLLSAAATNPQTPVSRLQFVPEKERRQLLIEWNNTAAAYPANQCLHELFEGQVSRTPDRLAIRCGEQSFTYTQLNDSANQLAHYLRRQGVGPDRLVALYLERSADTMLAVLAILKAGGAYVPLNPDNPPARLKQQLEGVAALVTETKLAGQMPQFSGSILALDGDRQLWANEPTLNPAPKTTPESLMYVIYTSGSTGVPKGVGVRHRNVVNYSHFITQKLQLSNYPEGLQFATVSTLGADLGNTCIYPSLISGGSLHIIPYEIGTDSRRFADYCERNPIDVLKIVPSHLRALLDAPSEDARTLLPRKYLILGGETLTPQLVAKIESLESGCAVLNHYGPTETTIGSLTLTLNDYDWRQAKLSSIPIGRPIANTQVYILDQNLEPVPVGITGELYIAGAGVTAGYLGQPEKTAERFQKNPFVEDLTALMYRTGDLARYGADGNVEFLGRGDDQVKVRGFRVELGEIESVLARHQAVKQAVVLAKEGEQGDKRLIAYVVPMREAPQVSQAEELRAYLKQQVPDYMLPQAIVLLSKLPLNANGKIDRKALPEPEDGTQSKSYVAPRSPTEQIIANVWAEVLRRPKEQVGVDVNFFDLGGHSLLATQVISRIRRALDIELPLRTMFESPTIAGLAEQAESARTIEDAKGPRIVRVSRDQPLPLSFAQQRLWVLDRMEPNSSLYNIARAVRVNGDLDVNALIGALNEIVRRHESQRTTFSARENGEPVQVIADSLVLSVPVLDLTAHAEEAREAEAKRIATEEAQTPFDLSKGPLVRAKVLKLGGQEHVLLLTMHHIVSDAWSAAIFFEELNTLYSSFVEGKPSPLPELAIQYGDYAAWQRSFLQGPVLDKQLAYWRDQLRRASPLLQLPTDRPRPNVRNFEGAHEPIPLPKEVMDSVKTLSQQEGVTPFMLMLAAFNALLFRHSGQEQIVLGTDIANRTSAETERLIGFFINLLPMHTDLAGDPTFRELLSRVREAALGAYAHQDLPFDKLVEELQPERSLSHNPIVQALFVMQNIPTHDRQLAGLEITPFSLPLTRSKFDVAVFIRDKGSEVIEDWVYSTELFERDTILRFGAQFENLLRHAISSPDTRVSALDILSAQEKAEREASKTERKQSQRKKLISAEPKAIKLAQETEITLGKPFNRKS